MSWLAEAGGAAVPDVLAVADDCLILAWIEPGRPSVDAAERLGRAAWHATHEPAPRRSAGRANGYIATVPLPNSPTDDVAGVLRRTRVLPYLKLARDRDDIASRTPRRSRRCCGGSTSSPGPHEPPSRIHGDLWSGNVVWSSDGSR